MTLPANVDSKVCPQCGHTSRMSAKNCSQCGTPFFLIRVHGTLRKRCANCGTYNRHMAKICASCGQPYRKIQVATRGQSQKWCPQCGSPRSLTAKVCTRCGFRFKPPLPGSAGVFPVPQQSPLQQGEVQAEAIDQYLETSTPAPGARRPAFDVDGEPAPYVSPDELKKLLSEGRSRWDFVASLIKVLLGDNH